MNNEKFLALINGLVQIRQQDILLAKEVVGETLFKDDLYFLSLIDKNMRLIDGFIDSLKSRNLTCIGILLRVQLDNCMRTYAVYIAEEPSRAIESIINSDIQLNRLNDKNGKKMTDGYLKKQLDNLDSRFSKVYKEASGYIHHSEKSFYTIASAKGNNVININVGHPLEEKYDDVILECAQAFLHFSRMQNDLMLQVIESKRRYDIIY